MLLNICPLLITSRNGPHRWKKTVSNSNYIVAWVFVAAGTCLLSRYTETFVVYRETAQQPVYTPQYTIRFGKWMLFPSLSARRPDILHKALITQTNWALTRSGGKWFTSRTSYRLPWLTLDLFVVYPNEWRNEDATRVVRYMITFRRNLLPQSSG
jgi:hypothetical protein